MKRILKWTGMMAAGLVLFSCSSTPEHAKLIPDNALMVHSINIQNMVMKAEPDLIMQMDMFEEMIRDIKNDANKQQRKLLDDFLDNPLTGGIDFLEPIYTFMNSADDEEFQYSCTAMILSSESNFGEAMSTIFDADIEEGEGFSYIEVEDAACIGWANGIGLIVISMDYDGTSPKKYVKELLLGDRSNSFIEKNEQFAAFIESEHDMGLFANWSYGVIWYESLFEFADIFEDFVDVEQYKTDLTDFENNFTEGSVVFNNNEINWTVKNHFTPEMADMLDVSSAGVPDEFMNSLTDDELISAFSMSVDIEKFMEFAQSMPGYMEAAEEIEDELGIKADNMASIFTGDMIHSLVGIRVVEVEYDPYGWGDMDDVLAGMDLEGMEDMFSEYMEEPEVYEQPMPVFISTIGVNNSDDIEYLLMEEAVEDNGIYSIDGMVHVTFYEDRMFITNDIDLADDLRKKGTIGTYSNGDVTDLFTENTVGGYINLDLSTYDKESRQLLQDEYGMYFMLAETFSEDLLDARMYGSITAVSGEMNFKDGEHNTLYRLIEAIGDGAF